MAIELDLPIMAIKLFSLQMGLVFFHGGDQLLGYKTMTLEQLLLNFKFPVIPFSTAVSPLIKKL